MELSNEDDHTVIELYRDSASLDPKYSDGEGEMGIIDSAALQALAFAKSPSPAKKSKKVKKVYEDDVNRDLEFGSPMQAVTSKPRSKKRTKVSRSNQEIFIEQQEAFSPRGLIKNFKNKWYNIAMELLRAGKTLTLAKSTLRSGLPFIILGLFLAFICELFPSAPRYNITMLLVVLASERFAFFPTNSVRPQLVTSLLTALTLVMDAIFISTAPTLASYGGLRGLMIITMVAKALALHQFLRHAPGTMRTRKYLMRRIRLFGIPLQVPKRIMRDVRGRMLAIGWLQLAATLAYFILFILSLTTLGYSIIFAFSRSSVPISVFLLIKAITSVVVFLGIVSDTDVVLCLGYFGCLGCWMAYVKSYTRRLKAEFGGWPYPFAFNYTRLQILTFVKGLDFVWGIVGWVSLGNSLRGSFSTDQTSLQAFLSFVVISLLASDIWVPLLFGGVYWLYDRYLALEEAEELDDSDDSELDEFRVRLERTTPPSSPRRGQGKKKDKNKESKKSKKGRKHRKGELFDRNRDLEANNDENNDSDDGSNDRIVLELFRHERSSNGSGDDKNHSDVDDDDETSGSGSESGSESDSEDASESEEGSTDCADGLEELESTARSPLAPNRSNPLAHVAATPQSEADINGKKKKHRSKRSTEKRGNPLAEAAVTASGGNYGGGYRSKHKSRLFDRSGDDNSDDMTAEELGIGGRAVARSPLMATAAARKQFYGHNVDRDDLSTMDELDGHKQEQQRRRLQRRTAKQQALAKRSNEFPEQDIDTDEPASPDKQNMQNSSFLHSSNKTKSPTVMAATGSKKTSRDGFGITIDLAALSEVPTEADDAPYSHTSPIHHRFTAPPEYYNNVDDGDRLAGLVNYPEQQFESESALAVPMEFREYPEPPAFLPDSPDKFIEVVPVTEANFLARVYTAESALLVAATTSGGGESATEFEHEREQDYEEDTSLLPQSSQLTKKIDSGLRVTIGGTVDTSTSSRINVNADESIQNALDKSLRWNSPKAIATSYPTRLTSPKATMSMALPSSAAGRSPQSPSNKEVKMILDPNATIDNKAFVHLWESLPITAEFTCDIMLIDARKRTPERGMQALVKHLQRGGFHVVAAGKYNDDLLRIYSFSCGYETRQSSLSPQEQKPTLCLLEMVIDTRPTSDGMTEGRWLFTVHCKSSEEHKSAFFIAELSLGDLFLLQ